MTRRQIGTVFFITLIIGVISWSSRHDLQETLVTVLVTAACATAGIALVAWIRRDAQQQASQ